MTTQDLSIRPVAVAAPADQPAPPPLSARYTQEEGVFFMSGNQALVRLVIEQRLRDRRDGLNTAGFISGYRGSPLGRLDMELWQAGKQLEALDIRFQPGINEDLAATAVWGTQHVALQSGARVDGVFGIWYGKGPGVDRSGDAFKHANAAGVSRLGGALVLAGDDHAAKSSTQAHQSDQALIAAGIPVLYPADVQDVLDFGLAGIAMSRFAGCWVALKLVTDVVEGAGPIATGPARLSFVEPELDDDGDRYIRHFEDAPLQEKRLYEKRLPAAVAFARANGLNRITSLNDDAAADAVIGIVASGKSWTDLQTALATLQYEGHAIADGKVRLLKVGMVWPLDPEIVRQFAQGLQTILVVEEKRPLVEDQVKTILYDAGLNGPQVIGKYRTGMAYGAQRGAALFPAVGEMSPALIADALAGWLGIERVKPDNAGALPTAPVNRPPTFCSGCPHSTSTRVPDGSVALAGIGCHSMAILLDPVRTGPISHMGAEGAMWVGQSSFVERNHVFANIGDGTYFHSGFLAVRQAIAAKVNITYKILLNGFVSMTGGQPIEGELTPRQLAIELLAEGVARVVVVTDDPSKYTQQKLPDGVEVFHRDRLDHVQRMMREIPGVSILIYDQMCATERRRQRKRGKLPDPAVRTFIAPRVCEGCGDCGTQSNCLSIEPLETEYGRKRQINQASCNKDMSCIKGFCPSFVTIKGGRLRQRKADVAVLADLGGADAGGLPEPQLPGLDRPIGIIVTGIGGTGVITVGAILTMAAHLDGVQATSLDLTGLAQKYGAVASHIHLARSGQKLPSYRLSEREADIVLGCDLIVTAGKEATDRMDAKWTRAIVNIDLAPTRDFARNPDWNPHADDLLALVKSKVSDLTPLAANSIARQWLGDPLMANLFVLGVAWQKGWIPVSRKAIEDAIRLNGVGVDANIAAFGLGRLFAHDPSRLEPAGERVVALPATTTAQLDHLIADRDRELVLYQNRAYAVRYRALVERVRGFEDGQDDQLRLSRAVAFHYYKLLAYKDEYEVARLYSSPEFREALKSGFDGEYKLQFHLGAGPFARKDPDGTPRKSEVGGWIMPAFHILAAMRGLRGSWLDPFARTQERRMALQALVDYEADIERILQGGCHGDMALAVEIASLPDGIRGYGPVRERHLAAVEERRAQLWARAGKATAEDQAA
ncbi:indolepyruvate ferredoxin oxidoreductase family protein [Sphingobium yanoikuyae]|uniref:Indolepyruvate ferredoxin oxidoreductase family protein n=1 Tax=Sphingobium yanoikuyae TaxID=13690 RepID=A0A9X7YAT7_SPHYA|nr:indolepyruvate ferredoxin oxidoreductase family protein [Sphingobium yanoikuyae]QNG43463.1 indolepyruvate ferredoxin oxidoreductase family protein [Sphingobium yanoikuyae]